MKKVTMHYLKKYALLIYETVIDSKLVVVISYQEHDRIVHQSLKQFIKANEAFYGMTFSVDKNLLLDLVGNIHMRPMMILGKIWIPLFSPKHSDYILVSAQYILKCEAVTPYETLIKLPGNINLKVAMSRKAVVTRAGTGCFIKQALATRKKLKQKETYKIRNVIKESNAIYYKCNNESLKK